MTHRYTTNPLNFDPARWLPGNAEALPRTAFLAFGGGATKCIGDAFAWTEMMVITATICSRFSLRPVPGNQAREIMTVLLKPSTVSMTVGSRH